MTTRKFGLLATVAGIALAASASGALAAATATVDGITFPVGIDASGSNQIQVTSIYENVVPTIGSVLEGVGSVTSITPSAGGAPTWVEGSNGVNLFYTFSNYTVANIQTVSPGVTQIDFKGGQVNFYVTPSSVYVPAGAGYAADLGILTSQGKLWLSEVGVVSQVGQSTGYTLSSNVEGTATSFTSGNSVGLAFLDVTGGDAAFNFATQSVPNGTVQADQYFTSTFDYGATAGYEVSGSATIKANAKAPEPATLSLLGVGLLGLGAIRRRRRA